MLISRLECDWTLALSTHLNCPYCHNGSVMHRTQEGYQIKCSSCDAKTHIALYSDEALKLWKMLKALLQ